jgi:ABC-type transport system involved in cytochrome bd biosynthesis fused ATPase/permease subunit
MEHFNDSSFNTFELQITEAAKDHLRTASGWALFISILGFIFIGLGLLGSLLITAGGSLAPTGAMPYSPVVMGLFGLFFNIAWGIPVLYLFKFATKIRNAVNDMSTQQLTEAFASLKVNFMSVGILIIVSTIAYIFFIIYLVTVAAGTMGHFN